MREHELDVEVCQETLRRLLLVVRPPADQPARGQALKAAVRALIALEGRLPNPDAVLSELVAELRPLTGDLRDHSHMLKRRLTRYPAWRMLLVLTEQTHPLVMAAIGAEIARCFVRGKAFAGSRADALRLVAGEGASFAGSALVRQMLLEAEQRFSVGAVANPAATQAESLNARYRALFCYQGEHQQQARRSHRNLAPAVFRGAMAGLRRRVEAGSDLCREGGTSIHDV